MNFKNFFKRRKNWSPYYGGNRPLGTVPSMPLRKDEDKPERVVQQRTIRNTIPEVDWEQRRFELMKMLIGQDRRSVVLGKLNASNRQIATQARALADAAIRELQSHPYKSNDDD